MVFEKLINKIGLQQIPWIHHIIVFWNGGHTEVISTVNPDAWSVKMRHFRTISSTKFDYIKDYGFTTQCCFLQGEVWRKCFLGMKWNVFKQNWDYMKNHGTIISCCFLDGEVQKKSFVQQMDTFWWVQAKSQPETFSDNFLNKVGQHQRSWIHDFTLFSEREVSMKCFAQWI